MPRLPDTDRHTGGGLLADMMTDIAVSEYGIDAGGAAMPGLGVGTAGTARRMGLMTRLIASICGSDQAGMVAAARDALAEGADWVELRLDGLPAGDDVDWPGLSAGLSGMPWLATVRSLDQGGSPAAGA
jgi:hypothetical protein